MGLVPLDQDVWYGNELVAQFGMVNVDEQL